MCAYVPLVFETSTLFGTQNLRYAILALQLLLHAATWESLNPDGI